MRSAPSMRNASGFKHKITNLLTYGHGMNVPCEWYFVARSESCRGGEGEGGGRRGKGLMQA